MKHTIKKQVLVLEMDMRLDAFALQQSASNYYWQRIVPVLERLFDQLSVEEEWVQLDRLEIDLGTITENIFHERSLDRHLYGLLRDGLREALDGSAKGKSVAHQRESATGHALRQWWYYMEHGRLHWGQSAPTAEWYGSVLERFSIDHAEAGRLRDTLLHRPSVMQRIVAQHTGEFLERLAGILVAADLRGAAAWVATILKLARILEQTGGADGQTGRRSDGGAGGTSLGQRLSVWNQRLRELLSRSEHRREEIVWRYFLREACARGDGMQPGGAAKTLLRWLTDDDPVLLRYLRRKAPALPAGMVWPRMGPGGKQAGRRETQISGQEDAVSVPTAADSYARPEGREPRSAQTVDDEGIYLPNAGIILLHPFIATCFSRRHWWEGGRFVDDSAREKAVFLLHYLATGLRGDFPEYELVLPRLLCGWPDETPLPMYSDLQAEDYAEADDLLEMVLQRWDKLKGSSIVGLREGFLQRGGKLVKRRGGLGLLVEQHAIDVLLDYLPWNLGIVKIPWLDEIIFVEWR